MEEVEHPQQYASLQPSVFNFMSSATLSTTPSLTNNVQRQQQQLQHNWLQPSQLTNDISQEQPSSSMGERSQQHALQPSSSTNDAEQANGQQPESLLLLVEAASNHNQDQSGASEAV